METKKQYFVEIIETGSGKTVEKYGPKSERMAERMERGISINLNHKNQVVLLHIQGQVDG